MAKANFIQNGDIIDYKNTGDAAVGYHDIIQAGSLIGIAQENIEPGAVGGIAIVGVHGFPTDLTNITTGQALYFDTESGKAVAEAGDTTIPAGIAVGEASGGVVPVKINAVGTGGAAGPKGDKGEKGDKGDPGDAGAAGAGVKSIALTTNADGKVTGGTWVDTKNKSTAITVTSGT